MAKALKTAALNASVATIGDNTSKALVAFEKRMAEFGDTARELGAKSERAQLDAGVAFAAEMQEGGLLHGNKDANHIAARAYGNGKLSAESLTTLASEFGSFTAAHGVSYAALDSARPATMSLYRAALKINRAVKRARAANPNKPVTVTESFAKAAIKYKTPEKEVKPEAAAKNAFDKLIAALAAFNAQYIKLAPVDNIKAAQAKTLRKLLERIDA